MSETSTAKEIPRRLVTWWTDLMSRPTTAAADDKVAQTAADRAPVIWLVGKVQAGKSSIVAAVTGATDAEVGTGFRPCTRTARVFDYPPEAPLVRFLDTRGLGEAGYVPAEDLVFAERTAHLLLVVMRALDPQQHEVLDVLAEVRKRRPDWPVVVAQTCLHDGYLAGSGHPLPYPYEIGTGLPQSPSVPDALARSLAAQREAVIARIGSSPPPLFVPIDFTRNDDGFEPRHYGLEALLAAISEAAPASIAMTLREIGRETSGRSVKLASPVILAYAAAAATADLVPLAGLVAVPGVQAKLLHKLATDRGVDWDRQTIAEFGGCLGAGVLTGLAARFGIRQLVKLVPIYGQTVGAAAAAASSFAVTYALGRAALVFLDRRSKGDSDPAAVIAAYRDGLAKAFAIARERGLGVADGKSGDSQRNA